MRGIRRGFLCLFVIVWIAGLSPPPAAGTERCRVPGQITERGNWSTIKLPEFPDASGGQNLIDYEVTVDDPSIIVATNGRSIIRSTNGGCTWDVVLTPGSHFPSLDDEVSAALEETSDPIIDITVDRTSSGVRIVALTSLDQPLPTKALEPLPGFGVLISDDAGDSWTFSAEGLPPIGRGLALRSAPSQPDLLYLVAQRTGTNLGGDTFLYASKDGGHTWSERWVNAATGDADLVSGVMVVDPEDPAALWVGGTYPALSRDGGKTWTRLTDLQGAVSEIVFRSTGGTSEVALVLGTSIMTSTDYGTTWSVVTLPVSIQHVSYANAKGDLLVTGIFRKSPAALMVKANGDWKNVTPAGVFSYDQPRYSEGDSHPSFFYNMIDRSFEVFRDLGLSFTDNDRSNAAITTLGCESEADNTDVLAGAPPPPGTKAIYASNFTTGCVIEYDVFGNGRVIAHLPYSEGITVDRFGRLIVTTRPGDQVYMYDTNTEVWTLLVSGISHAEGPTVDHEGNIFFESNNRAQSPANVVYELPYPQHGNMEAEPIYVFGKKVFLEDVTVAPQSSPYAGDLFVQYGPLEGLATSSVARLTRTESGWKRVADFYTSGENGNINIDSIGMDFGPDGSLYLSETNGSKLWKTDPYGHNIQELADIPGASFAKIDVDMNGYVYLANGLGDTPAEDPTAVIPDAGIVRLSPTGQRLFPDFTQQLTTPVGVAVIAGPVLPLPPIHIDPPPPVIHHVPQPEPVPPVRLAVPPPPIPPPPPPLFIPQLPPVSAAAPGSAPAQANAPANASASQGNPAAVAQKQQQPQMALVQSAQSLREQTEMQYAMARAHQNHDPLAAAKFGLAAGSLSIVALMSLLMALGTQPRHVVVRALSRRVR